MSTDPTRTWIRRASTAAGLAYTAIAEYELARRLGARPPIAVMLPMSIDCYVIAALKWFRPLDVALSLVLMCAAQVAAHALEAGVVHVTLELVTVVSLLVPVALWRTHALARDEHQAAAEPAVEYAVPVEVERVPEAYPERPTLPQPVPEVVPAGARLLPIMARPKAVASRPAVAAEASRARAEVRAEYVPEAPAPDVPVDEVDPLAAFGLGDTAQQFRDELLAGEVPSIRVIKDRVRCGQPRAEALQNAFRAFVDARARQEVRP
ncbi:hypothetical protein HUT18_14045 [Streptomyces sp. NA04227]|uniref:hypothetical protein n=1 Tax=Streptomyces sp. NA04227 TaxID=2742136 RepID=UPI00158FF3D2|nr:hypothetical protein [Streptomyces sp. NA04227]QKW07342.1 hypothetical protein HUT18_14045 [Streptomyces sp. NA04227]